MQETLKKKSSEITEPIARTVTLCIGPQQFVLNGEWSWTMQSAAVYCSQVMDFPAGFEGTKGIIHPDDLQNLGSAISLLCDGKLAALDFRIITTYGEVQHLGGKGVSLNNGEKAEVQPEVVLSLPSLQEFALRREAEALQQRKALADAAEGLHHIGTWVMNKSTGDAWYSDGMFRLHALPPGSLNAHQNTFHPFLHPDDRAPFLDAFEAAYKAEVPLHLEYRIQLADGTAKTVRLVTQWAYNSKGQPLFSGILHDRTEEETLSAQLSETIGKVQFQQGVLKFSEQHWNTGYWFINLVTRKITYSDNYYRIYGLKANHLPNNNAFLNLVHPEDRERIGELINNMYRQHSLPEAEFRIIRPDGKQRQLKQSGRALVSGTDLVMVGVVQDITVQRGLEKKVAELNEKFALQAAVQHLTEAYTETSIITWDPEGQPSWSEGFFRLLGYKADSVEPSARMLHRQIHPEDLRTYKQAEILALNGQPQTAVRFRLINRSGERQVSMNFLHIGPADRQTVIGLAKDQTKDELLRQKLTEKDYYIEVMNANITDALILTDTDNTVLSWNRAAEEKTGIRAADAVYGNLFELLPSLQTEHFLGRLQTARLGTEVRELAVRNLYLRQSHHYLLLPLRGEKDEATRILHVVQDVSRELDLQQQLAERLRFIESLVEASVDRIVVLDKHMNYLYWNRQAEEYYAISKTKVIGRNIMEVFPALRADPGYGEFRKVLKGETVYLPPTQTEDGAAYFETYLIPVKTEEAGVTAILWIVHDLRNEWELQQVQRQARQQLEAEHRRLKEAQAIGRVGSFEWVVGESITHWSDELYRINGLEPRSEEITLEKVDLFVHPEDWGGLQALKAASMKGAGSYQIVHRIVRRDGEVRWVNHDWESIANAEGEVVRVTGIVQDITEQRKAEEEIRTNRQLLKTTINSSMDMIQVFEAVRNEQGEIVDFKYLLLNEEAERWMPDAVGKSLLQLQPGVLQEGIFDAFKQVTESGVSQQYEKHYVHEQFNGWYLQSVVKLNDGVATATKDITKRKKFEQELRESKTLLQDIIDAPRIGMAVYKAVLNEKGEIVDFIHEYINRESITMLGGEDFTGRLFSEHGENALDQMPQFINVIETGGGNSYTREAELHGQKFWFAITNTPLDGERLVHTWEDVTERKKAEAEILRLKDEIAQRATDKYQTLFNTIDEGFAIQELLTDDDGNVTDLIYREVNGAFEQHTGMKNAPGKKASDFLPHLEQHWLDAMTNVYKTGEPLRDESYAADLARWFTYHYSRIGGAGSRLIAVVFNDITERKQQEQRQAFLLKLSDELRKETTADATANRALQLLYEQLGLDRCYVGVYNLAGDRGDFTHQVGNDKVPPVPASVRLSDFPDALKVALDRTFVMNDVAKAEGFSEMEKSNLNAMGMCSLVAASVRKGDNNPIWSIVAISASPRRWTEAEIQLMEEATERSWTAIERAKIEDALRQSEARLAQDLADAKLLQQFSNEVIHRKELNDIYEMLLDTASKLMQSDFASLQLYVEQSETLTLVAHKNFHPESALFWNSVSAASGSVCGEALRHQSRITVTDVETEEFAKGELQIFRASGIRAVNSTPINSTNGKLIGMLNT